MLDQRVTQREGVFHCHSRSRADGKMRGMCSIAKQDDARSRPRLGANRRKLPPDAMIRNEGMAVEFGGKQLFEERYSLPLVGAVQPCAPPRVVAAFGNESGLVGRVLIRVQAPQAVLAFLEIERERREGLRGSEPDEAVGPQV